MGEGGPDAPGLDALLHVTDRLDQQSLGPPSANSREFTNRTPTLALAGDTSKRRLKLRVQLGAPQQNNGSTGGHTIALRPGTLYPTPDRNTDLLGVHDAGGCGGHLKRRGQFDDADDGRQIKKHAGPCCGLGERTVTEAGFVLVTMQCQSRSVASLEIDVEERVPSPATSSTEVIYDDDGDVIMPDAPNCSSS